MRPLLPLLLVLLASCDEPPPRVAARPVAASANLATVLSLRANQNTLLAIGTNNRVYFSQPDAAPDVTVLSPEGPARPTALTSANVAKLLNKPAGDGRVRALIALPGGDLLAYFGGTARRDSLAALVRLNADADMLSLVATSEQLAAASGLGRSLDLAEAQMTRTASSVWLWLRTLDQNVFLQLDVRQFAAGGVPRLARPFGGLTEEAAPFAFAGDVLCSDGGDALYLLRPGTRDLWTIDPAGRATRVDTPGEVAARFVPPLAYRSPRARDAQLTFWPDTAADLDTPPDAVTRGPRRPALRLQTADRTTDFDRDALRVRPAFPLHALRLGTWALEPTTGDVVAYDAMSGEILRITFAGI